MLKYLIAFLLLSGPASAQEAVESLSAKQQYQNSGKEDARELRRLFDTMEKPKYQRAYDQYLEDLKLIARYGKAQDNEDLYRDIRAMISYEPFIVT